MPAGYRIASQAQTQQLSGSGNLVDYVQVVAVSDPEEFEVTVRVPLRPGWPDEARTAIEDLLADMRSLAV